MSSCASAFLTKGLREKNSNQTTHRVLEFVLKFSDNQSAAFRPSACFLRTVLFVRFHDGYVGHPQSVNDLRNVKRVYNWATGPSSRTMSPETRVHDNAKTFPME